MKILYFFSDARKMSSNVFNEGYEQLYAGIRKFEDQEINLNLVLFVPKLIEHEFLKFSNITPPPSPGYISLEGDFIFCRLPRFIIIVRIYSVL